jgi:hypothetical protein
MAYHAPAGTEDIVSTLHQARTVLQQAILKTIETPRTPHQEVVKNVLTLLNTIDAVLASMTVVVKGDRIRLPLFAQQPHSNNELVHAIHCAKTG